MYKIYAFALIVVSLFFKANCQTNGKIKVFILAGQSNMEGRGIVKKGKENTIPGTLTYIVTKNENKADYAHLMGANGKWASREDVWVWFHTPKRGDVTGDLAPGFGFYGGTIGPEMGFGWVMGDHYEDPVLLIKAAWGATSLAVDWRPPSAGGQQGPCYNKMLNVIDSVTASLKKYFPDYDGNGYEIVGFAWHQGWHDRVNAAYVSEYASNLFHFINDVRSDLEVPNLPFVIAVTGMQGWEEKGENALALMDAQFSMADKFKGSVNVVETRGFWRPIEESPGTQGYHWNDNAESYYLIGKGLADSMLSLMENITSINLRENYTNRFLLPGDYVYGVHGRRVVRTAYTKISVKR